MPSIATSALRLKRGLLERNLGQLRMKTNFVNLRRILPFSVSERNEVTSGCFDPMPSPRSAASAAPGTLPPSEWRGDQKSQCKRRRRDC